MNLTIKIRRQSAVADTIIGGAQFSGLIVEEYAKLACRVTKCIWNLKK